MGQLKNLLYNLESISASEKIFFLQNLAVMIKAGVSLADALDCLAAQTNSKKLKYIIKSIVSEVKQGKTFSESLSRFKDVFGEMFINMVAAGENSGRLENVLLELHLQAKRDHLLMTKVKNALAYPVIVVVVIVAVGAFAIFFILPNIAKVFGQLGADLPLPTLVLIALSKFLDQYGLVIGLLLLAFLYIFMRLRRLGAVKYLIDRFLLHLPVISPIIKQINVAKVAQNLSSLINTDIDIVKNLKITSMVMSNQVYKTALSSAAEKVKKGRKLADIFGDYPDIFPPIFIQLIAVGEETGALGDILKELADFYREEVFETLNNLPTIIEPTLIILIGLAVISLALAILMPMYSLVDKI